jgi:PAS domain S-box-containing protein
MPVGFVIVPPAYSWHNLGMAVLAKIGKPNTAPALFRLLEEATLSRAALGCCGIPFAMLDASAKSRPITYVNSAFEAFFGYRESDALGRSLAAVLLRNDEPLLQRLLAESSKRWEISAWSKDGEVRHVEVALAALHDTSGKLTHWVVAFSDCAELERLRSEVQTLKSRAAAPLDAALDAAGKPARSAQKARVEVPAADELHADRQPPGVLHQR